MSDQDLIVKIRQLEEKAELVRLEKERTRPRRPLILEFCGAPNAGKSTTLEALGIFLRRNNFRVHILTEKAAIAPVRDKTDWLFNVWTVSTQLAELIPYIEGRRRDVDVVLCDRGIFDALCWFQWMRDEGRLDPATHTILHASLTLRRYVQAIDLIYVFDTEPQESIRRENAMLLTRKEGPIMNVGVLAGFRKAVQKTITADKAAFKALEELDTTSLGQAEAGSVVTDKVLEVLYDVTLERVGYLPRASVPRPALTFRWEEVSGAIGHMALMFGRRPDVEADKEAVQPIPIAVITDAERSRVLVFRKTSRSIRGTDSPEGRKTLPYAGGHIRLEDAHGLDGDLLRVFRTALKRELKEEVGVDVAISDTPPILIWDVDAQERSSHHLAVCFVGEMDFESVQLSLDTFEFVQPGKETISGDVIKVSELVQRADLEPWGRAILREWFGLGGEQLRLPA